METHIRSILKAISWRAGGTMVTFAIAWILTREFELSAQIGILDMVIKVGAFYAHERLWNLTNFGKKQPEYHI